MPDSSLRPALIALPTARFIDDDLQERLVGELRQVIDDRLFVPPRVWIDLAGFQIEVVPHVPPPESWDGTTVFYPWFFDGRPLDGRRLGWYQYEGLGRAFLIRRRVAHTSVDLRHFALALAVPFEVRRAYRVERIASVQPHCPIALIEEALSGRR